jgi:3-hydroxyisobutyrate dehydrogenase
MSERVTLLGLGTMGSGMAGRLLKAGIPLTVWNRTPGRAAALQSAGARVALTPRDAVRDATSVISMLSDVPASRAVWLGENGALAGVAPGTLLIESSTITPSWLRELDAAARVRGCTLIDAPVTGSRNQAAAGELLFLAGGEASAVERATPILRAMGRDVVRLGPLGSGATLKLINNFICAVQLAAFGEALAFLDKTQLDPAQALPVLLNGAPGSPLLKGIAARIAESDSTVHFALGLMQKDVTYAIEEAGLHSINLRTADLALELLRGANKSGFTHSDLSGMTAYLRGQAPPSGAAPGGPSTGSR